jgi:hypothetical protein
MFKPNSSSNAPNSNSMVNSETAYTIYKKECIQSEVMPISMIEATMQYHLPSAVLLHWFTNKHYVYKIKTIDLLQPCVKNWSYNRPPDMSRCPDIARYIHSSLKNIDSMIYLSYSNITESFNVIDGIHRLTALKFIRDETSCPREFNNYEWVLDQYLIVNIRFNAHKGELIELFETLNKSQTVPELYIKDTAKEKKTIINSVVNDYQVRYATHFTSSAKPNTGHTNRDLFVNVLDRIYDCYGLDETGEAMLRRLLEEANNKIMNSIPSKATVDMRLKCKDSNCYLFLLKNDKLEKLIRKIN